MHVCRMLLVRRSRCGAIPACGCGCRRTRDPLMSTRGRSCRLDAAGTGVRAGELFVENEPRLPHPRSGLYPWGHQSDGDAARCCRAGSLERPANATGRARPRKKAQPMRSTGSLSRKTIVASIKPVNWTTSCRSNSAAPIRWTTSAAVRPGRGEPGRTLFQDQGRRRELPGRARSSGAMRLTDAQRGIATDWTQYIDLAHAYWQDHAEHPRGRDDQHNAAR